jgi:hypothetical protein
MNAGKGNLFLTLMRRKEPKLEVMIIEKGNLKGGANLQMQGAELSPLLRVICIALLILESQVL